jgi:Zn-dependent protease/CBS domain-containing protein
MKRHTISLGTLLGIPLELDYSWFLIFALLTWTLAVSYYPNEFQNVSNSTYWVFGGITALMLFVSVVLHELGHSILAMRYRIPVRRITLFIFGGISQISGEPPDAFAELVIALAGPIVSFGLAGLFWASQSIFPTASPMFALTKYLAYINGSLGVFNLVPGFPLDGGRVFRAIVWGTTHDQGKATRVAATLGRFIGFGFIAFGVWGIINGDWGNGLWIAFIGWFLESAAASQVQSQLINDLLAGHRVSEIMSKDLVTISKESTLQDIVDERILAEGQQSFIIQPNGTSGGFLTLNRIRNVPRQQWKTATVAETMVPVDQLPRVSPDEDLIEALKQFQSGGEDALPVVVDGQIVGIISRESLVGYFRALHDFGH